MNGNFLRLATVDSIGSIGVILRFDGEANARTKEYKCLASYTPQTDDRVCVAPISGSWIVLGAIHS